MKWFKRKTIVAVTYITRKGEKTKTVDFDCIDAKRNIYEIMLSPSNSVRVEIKL